MGPLFFLEPGGEHERYLVSHVILAQPIASLRHVNRVRRLQREVRNQVPSFVLSR